jgi:hypothetical protein
VGYCRLARREVIEQWRWDNAYWQEEGILNIDQEGGTQHTVQDGGILHTGQEGGIQHTVQEGVIHHTVKEGGFTVLRYPVGRIHHNDRDTGQERGIQHSPRGWEILHTGACRREEYCTSASREGYYRLATREGYTTLARKRDTACWLGGRQGERDTSHSPVGRDVRGILTRTEEYFTLARRKGYSNNILCTFLLATVQWNKLDFMKTFFLLKFRLLNYGISAPNILNGWNVISVLSTIKMRKNISMSQ